MFPQQGIERVSGDGVGFAVGIFENEMPFRPGKTMGINMVVCLVVNPVRAVPVEMQNVIVLRPLTAEVFAQPLQRGRPQQRNPRWQFVLLDQIQ